MCPNGIGVLVLVLGNAVRTAASVHGQDLYEEFKLVERPSVYCCPPDQWWAARKATLMALMDSQSPQEVTYIVFAPENPGAPAFTRRMVDGLALKQLVEAWLGKSIDSLRGGITPWEAEEMSRILFE